VTALASAPGGPVQLNLPRPRPDQGYIIAHPAKVKILAMGRRWGKTVLGLIMALTLAINGGRVAWIVPTYKNARAIWRATENLVGRLPKKLVRVNRAEHSVEFLGSGGHLLIFSADNPDAIRGEWFHLVILDEAARMPEEIWIEVIQPTLADVDGRALIISTPKGRNWFFRLWESARRDGVEYAAFRAPSSANPSPQIREAARRAKLLLPTSTYEQEWEANFVQDNAIVFSREWWEDGKGGYANRYDPDDPLVMKRSIRRWIMLDTALKDKTSSDYSAATVADLMPDWRLVITEVWQEHLSFPNLIGQIEAFYRHYNRDNTLEGIIIEDKVSGTSAYQTLTSASADPYLARLMVAWPATGSKGYRAGLAGVWCRNGCILLPKPGPRVPWLYAFEQQLFSFSPIERENEHDDMVDTFVHLINYLEQTRHIMSRGWQARTGALLQAG